MDKTIKTIISKFALVAAKITQDHVFGVFVFIALLVAYAWDFGSLGFYSDDVAFLYQNQTLPQIISSALRYVPGRNLHIIWQQLLFFICGGSTPEHIASLHLIQSILDALNVTLVFIIMRSLKVPLLWAFIAAMLFGAFPNHAETHFWLSSAPMNIISTMFLLIFMLLAVVAIKNSTRITGARSTILFFASQFLCFLGALFTYDQTFFILFLVLALQLYILFRNGFPLKKCVLAVVPFLIIGLAYAFMKLALARGGSAGGPSAIFSSKNIAIQFLNSLQYMLNPFTDAYSAFFSGTLFVPGIDHAVSVIAASLVCCGSIASLVYSAFNSRKEETTGDLAFHGWRRSILLVLVSLFLCFSGYLPNYLWGLAPRHNYLPSVGLFLFFAALMSIPYAIIHSKRRMLFIVTNGALLILVFPVIVFFFMRTNEQKQEWIEAYQLKKNLYTDIATNYTISAVRFAAIHNFPRGYKHVPFFDYENGNAINYLMQTNILPDGFETCSLDTPEGHFFCISQWKDGLGRIRYLPRGSVLKLFFTGYKDRFHFSYYRVTNFSEPQNFYSGHYYTVLSIAAGERTASMTNRHILQSSVHHARGGMELRLSVDVNSIRMRPGEVLGMILWDYDTPNGYGTVHSADVPLRTNDIGIYAEIDRKAILPIQLPPLATSPVIHYSLIVKDRTQMKKYRLSLYRFGPDPPVLLDDRVFVMGTQQ
ncbi:MAG: hypothetical protein AABZ39_09435 [Spirochaetota bacterium]